MQVTTIEVFRPVGKQLRKMAAELEVKKKELASEALEIGLGKIRSERRSSRANRTTEPLKPANS